MQSAGRWRIFGSDDCASDERCWATWRGSTATSRACGGLHVRGDLLTVELCYFGNQADWPALQGPHIMLENAACATRHRRLRSASPNGRGPRRSPPHLSRPAAPHGAGSARCATSSMSMTARRPTPTAPRRRSPLIRQDALDPGRTGQDARPRRLRTALRPRPLGAHHRSGGQRCSPACSARTSRRSRSATPSTAR